MPAKVLYWRGTQARGLARLFAKRRLRRTANQLLAECQAECPVDSGDLRKSHGIAEGPTPYGFSVVAPLDYALPVHEGFTHYRSGKKIPPNPWMERAARNLKAKS